MAMFASSMETSALLMKEKPSSFWLENDPVSCTSANPLSMIACEEDDAAFSVGHL